MEFWRDFKPVLLTFIAAALTATAVLFMLAARHDTIKAMTGAEEQAAVNLLDAISLDIESQYQELTYFQEYSLERHKSRVRDAAGLVRGAAAVIKRGVDAGRLTPAAARAMFLDAVTSLRYADDDYFYVYDRDRICLAHPNPDMVGKDLTPFRDAQGRALIALAWEETGKAEGFFDVIDFARLGSEQPEPKLVYFTRIPEFDLLLGSGVYIGDIERDLERKTQEMIASLGRIFKRIRIAQDGYVWMFTGQGEILLHPDLPGRMKTSGYALEVIERLKGGAGTGKGRVEYLWDTPGDKGNFVYPKISWVRRFAPLDWYVGVTMYASELSAPAESMVRRQSLYLMGILVVFLAGGWLFATKVTSPLSRLTRHARNLAANDFACGPEREEVLPALTFPNEIKTLSSSFREMEGKLADYLTRLTETTAAKERFQSELRIAHKIQMDMLPGPPPPDGAFACVDLCARVDPAKEVGGDLYDYFPAPGGGLCLLVGDVSGKGVPAALFMAQCKALIRGFSQGTSDPGEVLAKVNAELNEGNEECMFVTMFLAVLDPDSGVLRYADAGHNPPYLLRPGQPPAPVASPPGIPLGPFPAVYQTSSLTLCPGESMVFYTDGVTEAQNEKGEFFGTGPLTALLSTITVTGAADVTEAVFAAVEAFEDGAGHADDITVLTVRYLGGREG